MNTPKIEQLIEKYFNGETSLAEEAQLRQYFAETQLPKHLLALKPMFLFADNERKHNITNTSFDEEVLNKINKEIRTEKKFNRRLLTSISIGIAAAAIITITSLISTKSTQQMDSITNPEIAYQEISSALLFVSNQLNRGLKPVETSSNQLEKAMNPVKSFSKIDQTILQMSTFN